MAEGTIKSVFDALKKPGETLSQFAKEWKGLSDKDKDDLRTGVSNGTFNY